MMSGSFQYCMNVARAMFFAFAFAGVARSAEVPDSTGNRIQKNYFLSTRSCRSAAYNQKDALWHGSCSIQRRLGFQEANVLKDFAQSAEINFQGESVLYIY